MAPCCSRGRPGAEARSWQKPQVQASGAVFQAAMPERSSILHEATSSSWGGSPHPKQPQAHLPPW